MEVELKQKILRVTDSQFADLKRMYSEHIVNFSYEKLRYIVEDFKVFKKNLEDAYVLSSRLEDMLTLICDHCDKVKMDNDAKQQEFTTKSSAFIVEISKM